MARIFQRILRSPSFDYTDFKKSPDCIENNELLCYHLQHGGIHLVDVMGTLLVLHSRAVSSSPLDRPQYPKLQHESNFLLKGTAHQFYIRVVLKSIRISFSTNLFLFGSVYSNGINRETNPLLNIQMFRLLRYSPFSRAKQGLKLK